MAPPVLICIAMTTHRRRALLVPRCKASPGLVLAVLGTFFSYASSGCLSNRYLIPQQELARLKREAEGFPARLQKEAAAAAEQTRKETEARLEQQALGLRKDAESEKRLAELRIKTLEEAAARQQAQIAALEKQLAEAKQQVQDIAVKAIEGASGARALSHINQIAMEQAKNRPQG